MLFLLNQQVLDLGDRETLREAAQGFLGATDLEGVRLQDAVSRAWAALAEGETGPEGPCALLALKMDANACILARRADGETDLRLARLPDATLEARRHQAPKQGSASLAVVAA